MGSHVECPTRMRIAAKLMRATEIVWSAAGPTVQPQLKQLCQHDQGDTCIFLNCRVLLALGLRLDFQELVLLLCLVVQYMYQVHQLGFRHMVVGFLI